MGSNPILDSTNNNIMSTEKEKGRTVVKGFYNGPEEEVPVQEEEHFVPLPREEEPNTTNITWLIWLFGIFIALILAFTIATFSVNTLILKEIRNTQTYEQRRNRNNTGECAKSIYFSRTPDGVWEIQDCAR